MYRLREYTANMDIVFPEAKKFQVILNGAQHSYEATSSKASRWKFIIAFQAIVASTWFTLPSRARLMSQHNNG